MKPQDAAVLRPGLPLRGRRGRAGFDSGFGALASEERGRKDLVKLRVAADVSESYDRAPSRAQQLSRRVVDNQYVRLAVRDDQPFRDRGHDRTQQILGAFGVHERVLQPPIGLFLVVEQAELLPEDVSRNKAGREAYENRGNDVRS